MELLTDRLRLVPLTDAELVSAIGAERDAHMKNALSEMLAGCEAAPRDRLWYTCWEIRSREDGTFLGSLCFKGPPEGGAVEIGYGIEEPFWRRGYAYESAVAALDWAFSQSGVEYADAETEPDNLPSQRLLEKLGFAPTGVAGEEGPRYRRAKN